MGGPIGFPIIGSGLFWFGSRFGSRIQDKKLTFGFGISLFYVRIKIRIADFRKSSDSERVLISLEIVGLRFFWVLFL